MESAAARTRRRGDSRPRGRRRTRPAPGRTAGGTDRPPCTWRSGSGRTRKCSPRPGFCQRSAPTPTWECSAPRCGTALSPRSSSSWTHAAGYAARRSATMSTSATSRDAAPCCCPRAKDDNASCAIGPFIRLLDDGFDLDTVRGLDIDLRVDGTDGYVLHDSSSMREISRDVLDLVAATHGPHHQDPDGFLLFTGTLFAPTRGPTGTRSGLHPRVRRHRADLQPEARRSGQHRHSQRPVLHGGRLAVAARRAAHARLMPEQPAPARTWRASAACDPRGARLRST